MLRTWTRRLFRLILAGIAIYLLAALTLTFAGLREDATSADVIVVFGNKVEPSGVPSASLASRLDKAVELYQLCVAPYVIASGGIGKEGRDEAQVMADYMAERGVPHEAILVDSAGNNTYLTALHTRALAEEHGFQSFALVSHFYHLPRARVTFLRMGMAPVQIAHARRFVARDFYYGLMREVIAYPAYLLRSFEVQ